MVAVSYSPSALQVLEESEPVPEEVPMEEELPQTPVFEKVQSTPVAASKLTPIASATKTRDKRRKSKDVLDAEHPAKLKIKRAKSGGKQKSMLIVPGPNDPSLRYKI